MKGRTLWSGSIDFIQVRGATKKPRPEAYQWKRRQKNVSSRTFKSREDTNYTVETTQPSCLILVYSAIRFPDGSEKTPHQPTWGISVLDMSILPPRDSTFARVASISSVET